MDNVVAVPAFWIWASGIYFVLSIVWTVGMTLGLWFFYSRKIAPLLNQSQESIKRVSTQAKAVAAKVSATSDIVHAQTQNLLGNAQSAGSLVTKQARTVGAALTVGMVAARVVNFVRRLI
jgi:hypothetical protein